MLKNFIKWFSDLGWFGKILLCVIAFFTYNFIIQFIRKIRTGAQVAGDLVSQTTVSAQTGISVARLDELNTVAVNLQYSLWYWHYTFGFSWFGWTKRAFVDSDAAISALNSLNNPSEVRYVAATFLKAYPQTADFAPTDKLGLRSSIQSRLTASEQTKISAVVLGSLI